MKNIETSYSYFKISCWSGYHSCNGWADGGLCAKTCGLDMLTIFLLKHIFGQFQDDYINLQPRHTGVLYNPIFAVSRDRIRRYPKQMYEGLLREILRCTSKAHEGGTGPFPSRKFVIYLFIFIFIFETSAKTLNICYISAKKTSTNMCFSEKNARIFRTYIDT